MRERKKVAEGKREVRSDTEGSQLNEEQAEKKNQKGGWSRLCKCIYIAEVRLRWRQKAG